MNISNGHGVDIDTMLTTTRSVRTRLDLERAVDLKVVRHCIDIAAQAPNLSNIQPAHFLLVDDPGKRHALADVYRKGMVVYRGSSWSAKRLMTGNHQSDASLRRTDASIEYLAEHLHQVPVMVIPCLESWIYDHPERFAQATMMGSIMPAAWSFCLAAHARGLGTAWTTLHLLFEREAADILDIPYCDVRQIALIAVAHTLGTRFSPATRNTKGFTSFNSYCRVVRPNLQRPGTTP
jgi:nitroreductase